MPVQVYHNSSSSPIRGRQRRGEQTVSPPFDSPGQIGQLSGVVSRPGVGRPDMMMYGFRTIISGQVKRCTKLVKTGLMSHGCVQYRKSLHTFRNSRVLEIGNFANVSILNTAHFSRLVLPVTPVVLKRRIPTAELDWIGCGSVQSNKLRKYHLIGKKIMNTTSRACRRLNRLSSTCKRKACLVLVFGKTKPCHIPIYRPPSTPPCLIA